MFPDCLPFRLALLEKVHIATDRDGRRRGFAFVTFKHVCVYPRSLKRVERQNSLVAWTHGIDDVHTVVYNPRPPH